MKITRAAFATLLKYRDLQDDFNYIVETVELEGQVTQELLEQQGNYDAIMKQYQQAINMRQWISYEKKKRIEKREEGANTQEEKDKAFELAEKDI